MNRIEFVARALFAAWCSATSTERTWENQNDLSRDRLLEDARVAMQDSREFDALPVWAKENEEL